MIPMQLNFDGLEYVVGSPDIVKMMSQSEPLAPFDEKILFTMSHPQAKPIHQHRESTEKPYCKKSVKSKL